jgi:hypothetical protein
LIRTIPASLALLAPLYFTSCLTPVPYHENPDISRGAQWIEPVSRGIGKARLAIDPRLELLSVVQFLSDYDSLTGLMTKEDIEYKQDILDFFGGHKDDRAIQVTNTLTRLGFGFDAPPTAMMYLDYALEPRWGITFSDSLISKARGESDLKVFVESLQKFSRETGFAAFFENHREYYRSIVDDTAEIVPDRDYIGEMEAYYGVANDMYSVVLVPLFHPGGFGFTIVQSGFRESYSFIGPVGQRGGIPLFHEGMDARRLIQLLLHEFGHSFVNSAIEAHGSAVMKYASLFTAIEVSMKNQSYPDWMTSLKEHVLRAVVARIENARDPIAGRAILANEKSRGFLYVEKLYAKLAEYETNRSKYPTLDSFVPELLTALG